MNVKSFDINNNLLCMLSCGEHKIDCAEGANWNAWMTRLCQGMNTIL